MDPKNMKIEVIKVGSIAELTIRLLMTPVEAGYRMSNGEIVKKIVEAFPKAKTTNACVAWYASHMKNPSFAKKHGVDKYTPLATKKATVQVEVAVETKK